LDRTAWIVLIVCGGLLALNLHFMQKEAARERRERAESPQQEEPAASDRAEGERPPGGEGPEGSPEEAPAAEPRPEEKLVTVKSEAVDFVFTTYGGGIKYAEFREQEAVGEHDRKVRINRFGAHPIGTLTAGVDRYLDVVYEIEEAEGGEAGRREVTFRGRTAEGLWIRKEWSLVPAEEVGSAYRFRLVVSFQNESETSLNLSDFGIFAGSIAPLWKGEWENHQGVFFLEDNNFEFRNVKWFKGGKRGPYEAQVGMMGYAGVGSQFYASVVAPFEPHDGSIWSEVRPVTLREAAGGNPALAVRLAMSLPGETLAPGGDKEAVSYEVFVGPKRNTMLRAIGMRRGKVMNYGWFGIVSWPLNWLLNVLHDHLFDPISRKWSWGLAIVALTLVIRSAMWPLQNKSTRAMKRMAKLQPEMQKLKEKYPDDPHKMNQEMMKMYREYGINPIGGCLPLVVQIPIFFGFYRMLQFAVELRQAEFLWVDDLSQPDTVARLPFSLPFLGDGVNLLPILMAVTMVVQMMMTPKTGDKMQRRIFMIMPFMFFFFCYNFASALALYWTTSNLFAIAQTLITKRLPEPELKKKSAKKKGIWQRMQEQAEAAQRAQKARQSELMGAPQKKPRKRPPRTGG